MSEGRAVVAASLASLTLWASCAGAPVTPEQRRAAEERLLAPFARPVEVGCGQLRVELTANFYANVGRPAIDAARHRQSVVEGDGFTETTWTNIGGQPAHAFTITIGAPPEITETGLRRSPGMTFTVVDELKIRVYSERRPLTLCATAGGSLVVIKEAAGQIREVREFAIADGVVRGP
jgi:hypothetical protein